MNSPATQGVHHIGLTVSALEESAHFFTTLLGWTEVKRREDYPAIFVSDGTIMLTLWQVQTSEPVAFDRKNNVGLHHLAIKVDNKAALFEIFEKLSAHNINIEFAPSPIHAGPAMHMMCYEPSGIRIEFYWSGQ
ncbi:VOC family protein [Pectobacterium peruviense]|uniref:Glyoxalase n=1 Tax=Pectobacterium peruviense TaxID=2066479 RepID=A0ABX4S435_9GAMM|nr:VOC family protein [Pectobacterium peruviense]KML69117.1 glyoxalase [Pectobacterium peruviense]PKX85303.1 glyoxalase [Pectobacterium peruviense]